VDLSEYLEFLRGIEPGTGGELILGEREDRRTVKRRLTTAAQQLHMQVRWRRGDGDHLRFEVY